MIQIAGVTVATPSKMKISRADLTKSSRTASGLMVMELIAIKRRIDCTWTMLKDSDLKLIIDTITANKPFFSFTYPDAGGDQTMTCYAGDINTSLFHTLNGVKYWDEVSISFIEQ